VFVWGGAPTAPHAHLPALGQLEQTRQSQTQNTWSHTGSPSIKVMVLWKPRPGLYDLTQASSRAQITRPSSGSSSSRRMKKLDGQIQRDSHLPPQ
jgi:hypothetical protein